MKEISDLKEVKKNKCGSGLLIENDGYVTTTKEMLKEGIENKDEWYVPYPFVVNAVFQKFGIKNANGRVYPENVLKREVERYQEKIKDRRALGECYTEDAMILTADGWKSIKDVKEGEYVLTLNTSNNDIEINPILRKIEKDWDGEIYKIKGYCIKDKVTPNHKYPLYELAYDDNIQFKGFYSIQEIESDKDKFKDMLLMVDCDVDIEKLKLDSRMEIVEDWIISKEKYIGKVYCVEVENHTFFVKQGNLVHLTANCNHPESSSIDLSRVSHNITELHWEGSTLVGTMEIFTSYGFRKQGIVSTCGDMVANLLLNGYKIGVSSRAIGSVEEKLGVLLVGDDLELLCWDIVADPSTPNAYIFNSDEEKNQYVEDKKKDDDKLIDKINKIKNII